MSEYGIVADSRPIMVSGVYRSGTTFLTAMLGAHTQLKASSSTVKFLRFCLCRYGDISIPENYLRLIAETHKRVKTRWNLSLDEADIVKQLSEHDDISYARLYDIIMKNMLFDSGDESQRWVEKLAVQWEDIPAFLDMFPNGRVIHIFRDPRDVAASYKKMTFEPGETYLDAAFNFRGAYEILDKITKSYSGKIYIVQAEEIARNPVESAKSICEFLDLEYQSSMVDAEQLHTEGEDWASNTSYGVSYRKLPGVRPRWPENLSRSETIFIEMITQPYLQSLGYQTSGFFPSEEEWTEIYNFISEPFLHQRFENWLADGVGAQGYRSDPYDREMRIVFPERYQDK